MTIAVLFLAGAFLLGLAYRFYGRVLQARLGVDDARPTPAHTLADGVDYVPTANAVLFGHHFSSIAGAGPIVGPVIAGLAFGWAPALLWILLGAILIGGVHDFSALFVSIRNRALSVGEIGRTLLNPLTYRLFLVFILFTLVYVIIVFLDLTAATFAPVANAVPDAAEAIQLQVRQGGTVTTASLLYILLAVLFGLAIYRLKVPLRTATLVFVPLVFAGLWIGARLPLTVDLVPAVLGSGKNFWTLVLLVYCAFASVLPVWILLQPRDYLSSFLLYAALGAGAVGLVASGAAGAVDLAYPAFLGWRDAQLGFLYPTLFVTVACGAVSGFHAIVASGTSAKQLRSESAARVVGYGGMLVEAVLGLLALSTVMVLSARTADQPVAVFARGIGRFLEVLGLPAQLGVTFGMLAVSTFLLTTLDTCTRLARFIVHELLGLDNRLAWRIASTLGVLALPAAVVFRQVRGPGGALVPAWKAIWPAFGASNQLLAALALLVIFLWLRRNGRPTWFVAAPMAFMCITTLVALLQLSWLNLAEQGSPFVGVLSLVLSLLAMAVVADSIRTARARPPPPAAAAG